jgi:hypothetical protein
MGIHLAHNIRILKKKLKKKILRPDLAPLNLLFFQCLFAASGRGALLIMPRPQNIKLQIAEDQTFLLRYDLFLY